MKARKLQKSRFRPTFRRSLTLAMAAVAAATIWSSAPAKANLNDFVQRYLGQQFRGQGAIALRQVLGLGQQFNGRQVEYVMISARSGWSPRPHVTS